MSYSPSKIVKRAKEMKKSGVVYGYGYKYEKVTEKNLKEYSKLYAYNSSQMTLMKKKIGKMAIDCSGFVNRAAGTNLGGSSQINASSPQKWSVKDKSHVKSGMYIWRNGHVGLIYTEFGKTYIIEARSTADDITISRWEDRASHFTTYGKIKGVKYADDVKVNKNYTAEQFCTALRKTLNATGDVTNSQILKMTPTLSINKNRYHSAVDLVEKRLRALGYYKGTVESEEGRSPIFGEKLAKAVKEYEKKVVYKNDKEKANGVLESGKETWKHLMKN